MLFSNHTIWKPNWARRYDQAHSPLHMWTTETKELRSQLFPERRRIPSRKAKYLLAIGFGLQLWTLYHIQTAREQFRRRGMESAKLQRKAAPFLQAMADMRYSIISEKRDILMRELFDHDVYNRVKDLYLQKDIWVPGKVRSPHQYNRTSKDPRPYSETVYVRYLHGVDLYNI